MYLRRTILVALLLLGLLFVIPPARAAIGISSLAVKAELQLDGTVTVQQEIELVGSSGLDWRLYSNPRHLVISADGQKVPDKQ